MFTLSFLISSNPTHTVSYPNAIKVTVDGPREPRKNSKHSMAEENSSPSSDEEPVLGASAAGSMDFDDNSPAKIHRPDSDLRHPLDGIASSCHNFPKPLPPLTVPPGFPLLPPTGLLELSPSFCHNLQSTRLMLNGFHSNSAVPIVRPTNALLHAALLSLQMQTIRFPPPSFDQWLPSMMAACLTTHHLANPLETCAAASVVAPSNTNFHRRTDDQNEQPPVVDVPFVSATAVPVSSPLTTKNGSPCSNNQQVNFNIASFIDKKLESDHVTNKTDLNKNQRVRSCSSSVGFSSKRKNFSVNDLLKDDNPNSRLRRDEKTNGLVTQSR